GDCIDPQRAYGAASPTSDSTHQDSRRLRPSAVAGTRAPVATRRPASLCRVSGPLTASRVGASGEASTYVDVSIHPTSAYFPIERSKTRWPEWEPIASVPRTPSGRLSPPAWEEARGLLCTPQPRSTIQPTRGRGGRGAPPVRPAAQQVVCSLCSRSHSC